MKWLVREQYIQRRKMTKINRIDLHTHTTKSDGSLSPSDLVSYAADKGLSAIAVTDHDTIDGINEAVLRGKELNESGVSIEVIPGIEFSSEYEGKDIHIVGLYMDIECDYFKRRIAKFKLSRDKRNIEMCERLLNHGAPVTMEELYEEFPNSVITRAHFAGMLVKKGYAGSVREAFDRFVGDRAPCFVQRKKISPFRAVEIIRKSGGFPVLAHPVLYGMSKQRLDNLVGKLKACGLMGIEAIYSSYDPADERDIRALAQKYDLAISGGSDFHGAAKPGLDLGTGYGKLFVPSDILDEIKKRHAAMLLTNDAYRLPKILFTDLDSTLLRTDKTISEYTYDVLKRFTEAGHYLVLCSGRDINSVTRVHNDLKLNMLSRVFLAGYNGGEIYDCSAKQTVRRITLDKGDVTYMENVARQMDLHMHTYSADHIIATADTKALQFYRQVIKTPVKFVQNLCDGLDDAPCKCLAIETDDVSKLERFRDFMKEYSVEHNITMLYSTPNLLEIFPSSSGKGKSVKWLAEYLNIPGIVTVAAGDEQNDVSMLESADVAIAMKNGIEKVKNVSTVVTDFDNDHDGLADALEDLI